MSRIGKRPVPLPKGVTVTVANGMFEVKGPKGAITRPFPGSLILTVKDGQATVGFKNDVQTEEANRLHGTTRALINSAVVGVSTGFSKKLLLLGTGYKAEAKGQLLNLSLGLSHPVNFEVPKAVAIKKIDPKGTMLVNGKPESGTTIELESYDKETLGQVVANLQSFRPPEPYKGKGVNVEGVTIRRKAGKAGKAGAKGGK
jgi:large subunit ribosomal protein L6